MSDAHHDVLVLGAGAAGLASARKLAERGLHIGVVEARGRIGGRIHTLREPGQPATVELGAEFVHGNSPCTLREVDRYGLSLVEVNDRRLFLSEGGLKELPDFWQKLERVMKSAKPRGRADFSVARFLRKHQKIPVQVKALFTSYVEGFHAADTSKLSARALYESEIGSSGSAGEEGDSRILSGYDRLSKGILSDLMGVHLYLGNQVRRIEWLDESIRVSCLADDGLENNFFAKKLVVALPLGVLKADASSPSGITWDPILPPDRIHSLEKLEMGHVQRIIFRFRSRFLENLSEKPVSFLHAGPEHFFPSWWTLAPLRTNYVVAWQGGPKAYEMRNWGLDQKVNAAFRTLSLLAHRPVNFLEREMAACYTHDWSRDPFSLGAYSYVSAGGNTAATHFHQPLANRVFFASEASAMGEARGTVHGALHSGERAAKQVWHSLINEDERMQSAA